MTKEVKSKKSSPPDDRLIHTIKEMLCLLHRQAAGDALAIINKQRITMAQFVVLHGLRETGAQSIRDIAKMINLSKAATSHLVDRLVHEKLVARIEDETDRRQKRVWVTERAKKLMERMEEVRNRELQQRLQLLPKEIRDDLAAVLERILQHARGNI